MTLKETHLRPQQKTPSSKARERDSAFVRNVIDSTHFLKNGSGPGFGDNPGTLSFSNQKAKAIRLSDYSFPVFIIRKPQQRGSYSKKVKGALQEAPLVETDVK